MNHHLLTGFLFLSSFQLIWTLERCFGDSDNNLCSVKSFSQSSYQKLVEKELGTVCDYRDPLCDPKYESQPSLTETVDFIVVGAGAAGSVLASRLSEVSSWDVALLEAGGPEPVMTEAPSNYFVYDGSAIDWAFPLKPSNTSCLGKKCVYPRGKVMGGTTILNGLMYCRGDASDYDELLEAGCTGWSYKDVLPYFKKSEDNLLYKPSQNHAQGGLLTVAHYNSIPEFGRTILAGATELGYATDVDIGNGVLREGFYRAQMTTRNGARLSAAKAFVRPFLNRKNLKVLTHAQVLKVDFGPDKRALGVTYVRYGKVHTLKARKEVILSAGAIMSPFILLHSGVGPAAHLKEKDVPLVADVPGVGHNLRNHVSVQINVALLKSDGRNLLNNVTLQEFLKTSDGPMSSTGLSQIGAMIRAGNSSVPDLQIFFAGLQANYSTNGSVSETNATNRYFGICPTVLKTNSTGVIQLEDKNVFSNPEIIYNYFQFEYEMDTILKGIRFTQKFLKTKAMKKAGAKLQPYIVPGCENYTWNTDNFWKCVIRYQTNPENHQVGTCKMGPESDVTAVVDPKLFVRKVKNLRVVDASILRHVPSGNLMAPTIMIGEKAADMIKDQWKP